MEAVWFISVILAGFLVGGSWAIAYRVGYKKGYREGSLHVRLLMLQGILDARKREEKLDDTETA